MKDIRKLVYITQCYRTGLIGAVYDNEEMAKSHVESFNKKGWRLSYHQRLVNTKESEEMQGNEGVVVPIDTNLELNDIDTNK